jgi:hypothetical protein
VQVPVSPVSFVVAVIAPCVVLRALSSCRIGVAVAVVVPHSVLQLLSSCCTWGCSRGRMPCVVLQSRSLCCVGIVGAVVRLHGVVVVVAVVVPRVGRCRRLCAACGVVVAVVAPHVVSRSQSLRHVWCCGRGRCTAWVSWVPSLCHMWCCGCCRHTAHGIAGAVVGLRGVVVMVAVVAPRVGHGRRLCAVCGSWSPSLRRVWCRSRGHCAACGVAVAVVVLRVVSRLQSLCHVWCHGCSCCATCGVAVAVIAPCVVSWSQSLCRVWCRGRGHCAACRSWSPSLGHVGVAVMVIVVAVVMPHGAAAVVIVVTSSLDHKRGSQ